MNNNTRNNVPVDFAFYGTLRKGHGNYNWSVAKANGVKFEGTHVLPGFKMWTNHGYYPFITKTDNPEDKIVVECYHLPDEAIGRGIHGMELGAGYGVEKVVVEDKEYSIYVYNHADKYAQAIESGDWNEFVERKRNKVTT